MIYRYLIDGTLVDEPQGWDSLITTIKRDRNLKAILKSQDVTLKFQGTGYTLLKTLFDSGFCSEAEIDIQKSCDGNLFTTAYKGLLFTKYFEVDEKRCMISTKIEDNSFFARIFNNKSLECLPHVGFSKNNIAIDVAPLQQIKFFNPATGAYYPILSGTGKERSCSGYRVYDILKFLIDFMSDGKVDFDSSLFDTGGERAGMMFTTGIVVGTVQAGLSTANFEANFAKINFETFLKEVDKKCNIGFYVDTTGARPKIYIESFDALFENTNLLTITGIDELKQTIYQDLLFSKLQIGSTQNLFSYDNTSGGDFPETIDFLGTKNETFNILGVCNIDRTLDLTGDYVVSSNIIADGVVNQSDSWDSNFFFIDCTALTGSAWAAVQSNTLTGITPAYYYNQAFFNDQITQRYLKHVPNSIAFFLGNNDYKFQATKTDDLPAITMAQNTVMQEPIRFQNDSTGGNFDNNSSYNNTLFEFTIPQSGIFTFNSRLNLRYLYQGTILQQVQYVMYLREYDNLGLAGGNLLQTYIIKDLTVVPTFFGAHFLTMQGSRTINSTAGNKVLISFIMAASFTPATGQAITTNILQGSTFACTKTKTGGGIYQTYDPSDYSIRLHTFKAPMTEAEFDLIQGNVKGYLTFSRDGQQGRTGWIEQIKMDHKKGIADIVLNSSVNTNK